MLEIISHAPAYVWFLFAYLVWGGWKARRTYIVQWKALLALPIIMLIWSFYGAFAHYKLLSICLWTLSTSVGMWLGTLTIRKARLRFDKHKRLIQVAGSWIPMILSLTIFCLKYFLGVAEEMPQALIGDVALMVLDNISNIVSGMFSGRLIGYWQHYKLSPHVDLAEVRV